MSSTSDEQSPEEKSDGNRRRANRHRLHISATLREGATERTVIVTQISVGGMALRSAVGLEIGSTHGVESFDTLIPPGLRVRVVTARSLNDGTFAVGVSNIDE